MSPTRVNGDESDNTVYTPAPTSTPKTNPGTGSSPGTAAKTTTTTPTTKTPSSVGSPKMAGDESDIVVYSPQAPSTPKATSAGSSTSSSNSRPATTVPTPKAPPAVGSPKMAGDDSDKVVYTPQAPSKPKATRTGSSASRSSAKSATTVPTPKTPPTVGSPKMAGDESDRVVYTPMQPRTAPAASSGGGGGGKAGPVRKPVAVGVPPRLNGDESDRVRYTPMSAPAAKAIAGGGGGGKAGPLEPPMRPSREDGVPTEQWYENAEWFGWGDPSAMVTDTQRKIGAAIRELLPELALFPILWAVEAPAAIGKLVWEAIHYGFLGLRAASVALDEFGLLPGGGSAVPSQGPPKAMAQGGIVSRPTLAMLGEAGPEAVIPLDPIPEQYTQAMVSGGISGPMPASHSTQVPSSPVVVNVHATYNVSGQKTAGLANEDLVRRLRNVLVPGI